MCEIQKMKMPRVLDYHIHTVCTLGLLFLHFLPGASEIEPNVNYMLLIPAVIHYPSRETACLVLDGQTHKWDFTVTVTLAVQGQEIKLFPFEKWPIPAFRCYYFMVPPPSEGISEVAKVKIVAQGDIKFEESKEVLIQRISPGVLVQMDKPSYRPSDTVRFRIVTLDENFLCTKLKYYVVELKDPKSNRINQWLDVNTKMCIADLSFDLTTDPILGTYTIIVENGLALKTFIVQEEVLPRFEVTIEKPSKIFAMDLTFPLKVCGRYTYGKGVRGNVTVKLCHQTIQLWFDENLICTTVNGETDVTGCLDTSINASLLNLSDLGRFNSNVELTAVVEESGTGVHFSVSQTFPVSSASGNLKFEEMDSYYKAGHVYHITLVVLDQSGSPCSFKKAGLKVSFESRTIDVPGETDNKGRVLFSLDTSEWSGKVKIQGYMDSTVKSKGPVAPVYLDVVYEVLPYYSAAKSFLRLVPIFGIIPCGHQVNIRVEYDINPQDLDNDNKSVNFYYIVIGKRGILLYGEKNIVLDSSTYLEIFDIQWCNYRHGLLWGPNVTEDPRAFHGVQRVPITFTPKFGTAPKMLGFLLLKNGTLAVDRLLFNVDMCFPNQATLKFSRSEASPKAQLNLDLGSSVGSLCALRAVDKSVQISYEDKELTREMVFELFKYSTRGGYPDSVEEELSHPCWHPFKFFIPFYQPWKRDFVDIFLLFKEIGVKILTNTQILKLPVELSNCPKFLDVVMFSSQVEKLQPLPSVSVSNDVTRKFFPETWLWNLISIGALGHSSILVTVPDTITQFNARIFCMGDSGFGLSPQVSLTVFKPFFVDLALPYSIIQGETLSLKATVFNYLQQCLKVQVTLLNSLDFTMKACQYCPSSSCVCASQAVTFNWNITANKIGLLNLTVRAEAVTSSDKCEGKKPDVPASGKLDILQRQLLVKPRGIRKEITQNMLFCLEGSSKSVQKSFSIEVPNTRVQQSESAYISVMGDILGTALQNLDQLITMPYGCGEQNMLTMAPIVYVLDYLKSTGQLSLALKQKAIGYLQSGYQRQLSYKHSDGSYSAFGESDGDGSTWLTAFVLKCFYQAKSYIFIDDEVLTKAVTWLGFRQKTEGCFISIGKLYHSTMKGGVEDNLSLSAYITAALLERGTPGNDNMLIQALSCLKDKVNGSSNPYTLALLAYTFSLANDMGTRQILLDKLSPLAVSSGDDLYWTYNLQSTESFGLVSANVELSAYILLALITSPELQAEDILKASKIVSWLTKQQNSYGGFSSTQDTVVAIQALAKYTRVTFNPKGNLSVTVSAGKVSVKQFRVDKTNRLLLQTTPLPNIPGQYNLLIKGTGCVYIQSVVKYNELPVADQSAFSILAEIEDCSSNTGKVTLYISVSYTGSRNVSNMVLIEVEMLSGFLPSDDTATQLLKSPLVKKVNVQKDSVTVYLDELDHTTINYYIDIQQEMVVHDLKAANVRIYDYYQTGNLTHCITYINYAKMLCPYVYQDSISVCPRVIESSREVTAPIPPGIRHEVLQALRSIANHLFLFLKGEREEGFAVTRKMPQPPTIHVPEVKASTR